MILVVDDSRTVRMLISRTLENRGYSVMQADSAEAAEPIIAAELPQLIVLDAMMPGKSGFDLLAEMKDDPSRRSVPVIMLTAITEGDGGTNEYWKERSHADAFLSKPLQLTTLVCHIEALLQGKPAIE